MQSQLIQAQAIQAAQNQQQAQANAQAQINRTNLPNQTTQAQVQQVVTNQLIANITHGVVDQGRSPGILGQGGNNGNVCDAGRNWEFVG